MTHPRQDIRDAVAARLNGLATTAARVYIGRTRPLAEAHDPSLLIYSREERSDRPVEGNPGAIGRDLTLFVEGRVSTVMPPDDLLDTIAAEVEAKLRDAEDALDVFDILLVGTTSDVRAEGQRHLGEIRLEYLVRYSVPGEDE